MDESLSDFQETKKNCAGPKNPLKTIVKTNKPKRTIKRIRGQKDIRTSLKSKKTELGSYAKEFDNVCTESGIDVDSEQLQIAIALSKSLQPAEYTSDSSQSLNSQDRTAKIRTTLQEYGFKVPLLNKTNKRLKNCKKQYKLLLTSEAEKLQVIADKYSQVLFENLESSKITHNSDVYLADVLLYHLSTNATYDLLKDNQIFYIDNLIDRSTSTGILLRDWAKIPGRPLSPEFNEPYIMNFSEIECSQEELDIILSGTIKNVKTIIGSKQIEYSSSIASKELKNIEDIGESKENSDILKANKVTEGIEIESTINNGLVFRNNITEVVKSEEQSTATQQYRSCSPDIFDDEDNLSRMDKTATNCASQDIAHKVINNDFMDLTECVVNSKNSVIKDSTFDSNKHTCSSNITKRKSNDLMEITDCVASCFQPVLVNKNTNLHMSQDIDNTTNLDKNEVRVESSKSIVTSFAYSDELVNDVDLTESPKKEEYKSILHTDLTQSSSSSDDLPYVNLNFSRQNSLNNTIIINANEYEGISAKSNSFFVNNIQNEILDLTGEICTRPEKINSVSKEINNCGGGTIQEEEICDLTDEFRRYPEKVNGSSGEFKLCNESIFEEYVYNHSASSKEYIVELNCDDVSPNFKSKSCIDKSCENSEIDLTQTSNSSNDNSQTSATTHARPVAHDILDDINQVEIPQKSYSKNCLEKKNEISIDYDEISDKNDNNYNSHLKGDVPFSSSVVYDITDDYYTENHMSNGISSSLSQKSETFEISDKELDYSVHKSKLEGPCDNFLFGSISILDNFSNVPNISKSNDIANYSNAANNSDMSMNENILPVVDIDEVDNVDNKPIQINPYSAGTNTPKNCQYIVKTNEVTPMADYARMSTPERNRELDKYGLKPFKRKRAIQLLTHIYNQTHPIMEPFLNEDLPSPCKKRKQDNCTPNRLTASKLLKSPKSTERSPHKVASPIKVHEQYQQYTEVAKDNDYEVTSDLPDIKDIDCGADDWVFQKREKAKVYTCRLPLHIAFHNYVSCRRGLREAILRYEPINIDVIHKELVACGHRYDPKDLLKFMDKKCITVKTTDNDSKNSKRS